MCLIALVLWPFAAIGEVVEEIVAVVGQTPLLVSDLELATLCRLLPPSENEPQADYRARLLQARIRLELQFRNLESSGTVYRLELDLPSALDTLLSQAGGETELRPRLAAFGLKWTDVEELAVRVAAVNAYVTQRLRPRISVSLPELEEAYRELVAKDWDQDHGQPPPLVELREDLHRLLVERKLNDEIERWFEQARDQLEVTVYHPRP
jgi:hypothetical protein